MIWGIAVVGVCASALAVVLILVRHRRLNDWRLWGVPMSLAMLTVSQTVGLMGEAEPSTLQALVAVTSGFAALVIVSILDRVLDERERVHQSARMREHWVRTLTTTSPAVVWTTNRKGTLSSHVGGGHRQVGIRPNEFIGSSLSAYFGGERDAEPVWSAFKHALKGETVALGLQWKGSRYDGFVEPILDARSEVVGTIGFLMATTEVVAGGSSARENEGLLTMIAQQLPAAMWVTDKRSRITYASGALLKDVGLEAGDLVGASAEQIIAHTHPTDVAQSAHRSALGGESVRYLAEFAGLLGECFLEPLRDEDGQVIGVLGVAVHRSERTRQTDDRDRDAVESK